MNKFIIASGLAIALSSSIFAADGMMVYKKCIPCHGQDGSVVYLNKVPALTSLAAEERLQLMKDLKAGAIENGKGKFGLGAVMKIQMGPLSEDDLVAVNEYIETLKK